MDGQNGKLRRPKVFSNQENKLGVSKMSLFLPVVIIHSYRISLVLSNHAKSRHLGAQMGKLSSSRHGVSQMVISSPVIIYSSWFTRGGLIERRLILSQLNQQICDFGIAFDIGKSIFIQKIRASAISSASKSSCITSTNALQDISTAKGGERMLDIGHQLHRSTDHTPNRMLQMARS